MSFVASGQSETVRNVTLQDLFKFVLITFTDEEGLQPEDVHYFRNPIIYQCSEEENQRMCDTGIACYSYPNQLLTDHLVNDYGSLIDGE